MRRGPEAATGACRCPSTASCSNSTMSQQQQAQTAGQDEDHITMSSILLAPLVDLQGLAHTLFLSLSPPQTKPPLAPPLSAFVECDKALASAVNLAHVHQIKQRRIESLEQELYDLEARWREICTELAVGNKELEGIIEDGEDRIKSIEEAKKGAYYESEHRMTRDLSIDCLQRRYRTPNFWRTLKNSAPSHPHRRTCQRTLFLDNLHQLSSSLRSPTKRRCVVDDSTKKRL